MSFQIPAKAILTPGQLKYFQTCSTHTEIPVHIGTLNDAVVGVKLSADCAQSDGVTAVLQVLDSVETAAHAIPPVENAALRFGNPAFRTFYDRVSELSPSFHARLAIPAAARDEVGTYLVEARGNRTRIDYGSGMELNFLCWMCGASHRHGFPSNAARMYIRIMRILKLTYWLESAGSHSYIRPKAIHDAEIVEEYVKEYIYFACIQFINSVRTRPHLPASCTHLRRADEDCVSAVALAHAGISAVKSWDKVNAGMVKMYTAEVLGKLLVMQHFLFGSLLPYGGPIAANDEGD
ncbi:hypothetical protein C8R44DRAFT_831530 [Mycena epipterygia]|nr:hypothetical protein C8R44DRAFT_831530 [Mycena epipterygia]